MSSPSSLTLVGGGGGGGGGLLSSLSLLKLIFLACSIIALPHKHSLGKRLEMWVEILRGFQISGDEEEGYGGIFFGEIYLGPAHPASFFFSLSLSFL